MIELLLLCILIMQIFIFHSTADKLGRYAKLFNTLIHRPTKYMERKAVVLCCKGYSKGKENYQKVKDKLKEDNNG